MYCPECGKQINDGSKFCRYCGISIKHKPQEAMRIKKAEKHLSSNQLITNVKIMSRILEYLGSIMVGVAVLWWAYFWDPIAAKFDKNLSDVIECIYSTKGKCGIISGFAAMVDDVTPYNPIVFWGGIGLIVVGAIIYLVINNLSSDRSSPASSTSYVTTEEISVKNDVNSPIKLARCPNCSKLANPLLFLTYSRWSPYQCVRCGQHSKFKTSGLVLVSLMGMAVFFTLDVIADLPWFLSIAVSFIAILVGEMFLQLEPTIRGKG